MADNTCVQQKNLESSLLFMREEHAATLRALHDEIHKLQSKCTDLTFQLTMSGVSIEEGGDADSRMAEMTSELRTSQSQKARLEAQVAEQSGTIHTLTQELRAQRKRQLDETRDVEQTVSGLRAELEAKSNNVAYLTAELHRLKLKQPAHPAEGGAEEGGVKVRRRPQPHHAHLPAPPRDMLTNSARMRQRGSQAMNRSAVRHIGAVVVPQGSAAHAPDIAPFVRRDLGVAAVGVKKPTPLPPIAGPRSEVKEREVHRVVIASGGQLSRASVPEVATLAVDQINDLGWKALSQSHSCENN